MKIDMFPYKHFLEESFEKRASCLVFRFGVVKI